MSDEDPEAAGQAADGIDDEDGEPADRSDRTAAEPAGEAEEADTGAADEPDDRTSGDAPPPTGPTSRDRSRLLIALAVVVLVAVAAIAIRSRDRSEEGAGEEDEARIAYCTTLAERDAIRLPPAGAEPTEEVRSQVPVIAGRLILLSERMLETAPEDAREPLEAQIEAYRELVRTRDPAGFRSEELLEARNDANRTNIEECDMAELEFSAREYSYDGVPQAMRHGRVAFTMDNEGEQAHEMVLYRRNAESEGDFASVLSEGEQDAQAALITAVSVAPGSSYTFVADLAGGRYAMVCQLPIGDDAHWERGEIAEIEVQ